MNELIIDLQIPLADSTEMKYLQFLSLFLSLFPYFSLFLIFFISLFLSLLFSFVTLSLSKGLFSFDE